MINLKFPLQLVNKRWDALTQKVNDRQQKLERQLLQMGQFEQALQQLLDWVAKSDRMLDDIQPNPGDLKGIEIDLAKHKVIANDINAHQSSIDTLKDAGKRLMQANLDAPEQAQEKLRTLGDKYVALQRKLADKLTQLEALKREAESISGNVFDWLQWLSDVEKQVGSSKPVGGLPETAKSQLDQFLQLYEDMETKRPEIEVLIQNGQEYVAKSPENASSTLGQQMKQLRQRWDNLQTRASDKKTKLELALRDAEAFAQLHGDCIEWLTNAERILAQLQPPSRLLQPLTVQMEEHGVIKIFQLFF